MSRREECDKSSSPPPLDSPASVQLFFPTIRPILNFLTVKLKNPVSYVSQSDSDEPFVDAGCGRGGPGLPPGPDTAPQKSRTGEATVTVLYIELLNIGSSS